MLIPVQTIGRDSINLNYIPATISDTVKNTTNFDVMLMVKNNSLVDIVVTIPALYPCDQNHLHDEVITITSGSESRPIPLHSRITNYASYLVSVTYSSIEDVEVCAYRQLR